MNKQIEDQRQGKVVTVWENQSRVHQVDGRRSASRFKRKKAITAKGARSEICSLQHKCFIP